MDSLCKLDMVLQWAVFEVSVADQDSGRSRRTLKEAKHGHLLLYVVITVLVLERKLHLDVVKFKNFVVDDAPF